MYDTALARRVLEALRVAFPSKLQLSALQEALSKDGPVSEESLLMVVDGLHQEGKLRGTFLTSPALDGTTIFTDAGNLVITEKGQRELVGESASAPQGSLPKQDFSFVSNSSVRAILERDYQELQRLDPSKTPKAALVMAGAILEGILLDALVTSGHWSFEGGCQRQLSDMIGPAKAKGIISEDRLSDAVRRYRALVHPGREVRDNISFETADARLAHSAVDVIIREVRQWYSRQPDRPAAKTTTQDPQRPPARHTPFLPVCQQALTVSLNNAHPQNFSIVVKSDADEEFEVVAAAAEYNGSGLGRLAQPESGSRWLVPPKGAVGISWPNNQSPIVDLLRLVGEWQQEYSLFIDFILQCTVGDNSREFRKRIKVQVDPRSYRLTQI